MGRHEQTINDLWRVAEDSWLPAWVGFWDKIMLGLMFILRVVSQAVNHPWSCTGTQPHPAGALTTLNSTGAISDTPGDLFAKASSNHGKMNTLLSRIYQNSAAQQG